MAQFTPSALTVQSMGSMTLTIAHVNSDIISGTDYWTSGIMGIRSIMQQAWHGALLGGSASPMTISWTASSGTIWSMKDRTVSDTGLILWILSGGPAVLI